MRWEFPASFLVLVLCHKLVLMSLGVGMCGIDFLKSLFGMSLVRFGSKMFGSNVTVSYYSCNS